MTDIPATQPADTTSGALDALVDFLNDDAHLLVSAWYTEFAVTDEDSRYAETAHANFDAVRNALTSLRAEASDAHAACMHMASLVEARNREIESLRAKLDAIERDG